MIRATMRHDVETIRTLVSFTHKLFYTKRRKWSIAIGIVLILVGFLSIGTPFSMTFLLFGSIMACYNRLPERQAINSLIKRYKKDYPSMEYTFLPEGIHIVTTRTAETTEQDIPYDQIIRIVQTPSHNFLFNKKRAGCILDMRGVQPADRERLESHLAQYTGLTWEIHESPFRKKGL